MTKINYTTNEAEALGDIYDVLAGNTNHITQDRFVKKLKDCFVDYNDKTIYLKVGNVRIKLALELL